MAIRVVVLRRSDGGSDDDAGDDDDDDNGSSGNVWRIQEKDQKGRRVRVYVRVCCVGGFTIIGAAGDLGGRQRRGIRGVLV